MATYLYLRITDGTTTITFASGTTATPGNYSIDGDDWAPVIAGPEAGELNGGYYPPVEESIPINITGADSATMRANAQTLVRLLEQADRWARGDDTLAPVRLQYIPAGSSRTTSNPYERLILTSSQRDRNALQPGKTWSQSQATRFLLKAPHAIRIRGETCRQQFNRHLAFQARVFRQIHFTHPTRTELRQQAIMQQLFRVRSGLFLCPFCCQLRGQFERRMFCRSVCRQHLFDFLL